MDKEKFFQVFFQLRIPDDLIEFIINALDKEVKRNPHATVAWGNKTLDISMISREHKSGHPQTWMTGYIIVSLEEGTIIKDGGFIYWNPPIHITPSEEYSGHTLSIEVGNAAYLVLRYCKINHIAEFEARLEEVT